MEHNGPACQTANTIEMDRPPAPAQQTATLEQRQALACDVHDSVMQTLFSLHLAAEVALDRWEREPAQAHAALELAMRLIRDARLEMRTLLFELRENALQSGGLACALEQFLDLVRRHHDLRLQLRVACDAPLPAPYQETLYRLVQEGLTNVVKHAQARHASITLIADGAEISLRIEDDGIGFPQAEPECASCGLRTMRERVNKLGGALQLGTNPRGGAYVHATLPMPKEAITHEQGPTAYQNDACRAPKPVARHHDTPHGAASAAIPVHRGSQDRTCCIAAGRGCDQ